MEDMKQLSVRHVTVVDFIDTYLIKHIGEIKKDYPYFAFLLMAVGIEFLGKCRRDNTDWNYYDHSNPKADFDNGMEIPPLTKYSKFGLRSNLRNGLAHSFLTKGQLNLSDKGTDGMSIGCDQLYKDFVSACKEVINGQIDMPAKSLQDVFFTITETPDGSSITGGTIYNVFVSSLPQSPQND